MLTTSLAAANTGWVNAVGGSMRNMGLSMSGSVISVAKVIGLILLILSLIRIIDAIESDEKHGGFGNLSLWELIRPVVMYLILCNCPLIVRGIDGTVSYVSGAISSSVPSPASQIADYITIDWDNHTKPVEPKTKPAESDDNTSGGWWNPKNWWNKNKNKGLSAWDRISAFLETVLDFILDFTLKPVRIFGWLLKWIVIFIATAAVWLADILYLIIMIYGNMLLCLMAMFVPIPLAMSIAGVWKDKPLQILAKYIEISFWKPVGAAVKYLYSVSMVALQGSFTSSIGDGLKGKLWTYAGGAEFTRALVALIMAAAAITMYKSIPNITAAIFAGNEDTTGATGLADSATGIPGGIAKALTAGMK